nr:MAG TPA: Motilin/ghrelin [Bacteriophage sp.]
MGFFLYGIIEEEYKRFLTLLYSDTQKYQNRKKSRSQSR